MKVACAFFTVLLFSYSIIYAQNSEIQTMGMWSPSLERTIEVTVYTPPGYSYTADKPYRLYIFLHGGFGSVTWDYAKILQPHLDDLIKNNEIDPMIVVYPVLRFETVYNREISGDLHFFTDSERNGKYSTVISNDILEWMAPWYNVTTKREERGIGGFSMGADGALRIAIRNSDKFIAAVSHDGTPALRAWNGIWKQFFLEETPGPPYTYDLNNGRWSTVWYGLSAAYSPNLVNPNMPDMHFDFPLDSMGLVIDSVFEDKWIANHDASSLLLNPSVYKNEIAIYLDATDGGQPDNEIFHNELSYLGIPHTYKTIKGFHGLYPETIRSGLTFLDQVMDDAVSSISHQHNIAITFSTDHINFINANSNRHFEPKIEVKNLGSQKASLFSITCQITLDNLIEYSDEINIDELNSNDVVDISFKKWRPDACQSFDLVIISTLSNDENNNNDTLKATLTCSNLIDDFESGFAKWIPEGFWGVSNEDAHGGDYCIDDSPHLTYDNFSDYSLLFNRSLNLSKLDDALLSFWNHHSFVSEGDSGIIEVSTDNGENWIQLGDAIVDSVAEWYEVNRSLTSYCGPGFDEVWLRFRLQTDGMGISNGWFIDDLYLNPVGTGIASFKDGSTPGYYQLFGNYPNPFNPKTKISYRLSRSAHVKLGIYNICGQLVELLCDEYKQAGYYLADWDATNLCSGVYFYKFQADDYTDIVKCTLLK